MKKVIFFLAIGLISLSKSSAQSEIDSVDVIPILSDLHSLLVEDSTGTDHVVYQRDGFRQMTSKNLILQFTNTNLVCIEEMSPLLLDREKIDGRLKLQKTLSDSIRHDSIVNNDYLRLSDTIMVHKWWAKGSFHRFPQEYNKRIISTDSVTRVQGYIYTTYPLLIKYGYRKKHIFSTYLLNDIRNLVDSLKRESPQKVLNILNKLPLSESTHMGEVYLDDAGVRNLDLRNLEIEFSQNYLLCREIAENQPSMTYIWWPGRRFVKCPTDQERQVISEDGKYRSGKFLPGVHISANPETAEREGGHMLDRISKKAILLSGG